MLWNISHAELFHKNEVISKKINYLLPNNQVAIKHLTYRRIAVKFMS